MTTAVRYVFLVYVEYNFNIIHNIIIFLSFFSGEESKKMALQGLLAAMAHNQGRITPNNAEQTTSENISGSSKSEKDKPRPSHNDADSVENNQSQKGESSTTSDESTLNQVTHEVLYDEVAEKKGKQLLSAIEDGDPELVELFIKKGSNVNFRNENGITPLLQCARSAQTKCMRVLIENGANIEEGNNDGLTSLMICVALGHKNSARLLLENGANPNISTSSGLTALMMCANHDDVEIAEMLIEKSNVKVDFESKDANGYTALFHAGKEKNEVLLKLLLERGANINAQSHHNSTILNVSAESGLENIVDILLGEKDFILKS